MNTDRIKNIVIICLGFSLVILASLALAENERYYISNSQINAAISLLNANGVIVYANINQNFANKPILQIEAAEYDLFDIAERFFGGEEFIYEESAAHKIFYSEDRRIIFSVLDNSFTFEIPNGYVGELALWQMNAYIAHNLARSYALELIGIPETMAFHSNSLSFRGDYLLTYFGQYRNHRLYNNQLRIRVSDSGIEQIFYSYSRIAGSYNEDMPIFSPDEALLALLNHLRQSGILGNNIILSEMQLMHFIIDNAAVPAYIFTLFINEIQFNFIFNATTNRFLRYEAIR